MLNRRTKLNPFSQKRLLASGGRVFSTFTAPRKAIERSSFVAKVSAKRKAERPARDACTRIVRSRCRGACQLRFADGCTGFFQHVHEVFTRAQFPGLKAWLRPCLCLGACDVCNGAVESEPQRAALLGLRYSRKHWFNGRRFKALVSGMFPPESYGRKAA